MVQIHGSRSTVLVSPGSWRIFRPVNRFAVGIGNFPGRYLPITPPKRGAFSTGVARIARRRKPQQWPRRKFRLVCNNRFQPRSQHLSRGYFPRSTLCHEQFSASFSAVWVSPNTGGSASPMRLTVVNRGFASDVSKVILAERILSAVGSALVQAIGSA